ncbi:MAG: hypothetical protein KC502_03575 [Myxococcales bacterium]|nr:hypothetical protein [Myxococcales bacterium]
MSTPTSTLMRALPLSYTRVVLVAFAIIALGLSGCGKGSSMGASRSKGASHSAKSDKDVLSAKQIMQKGGLCSLDKSVDADDVDKGSDEEVILKLYTYALAKDSPATFKKFRALFPDSMNTRAVKENYWARIRKNVHKYMNEPGEPGFTICRTMGMDRGTKYFIKTNDRRQHPPPIVVGEVDGEKKIISFTPF